MPDEIPAIATNPEPSATPQADSDGGISAMMAQLDAAVAAGKTLSQPSDAPAKPSTSPASPPPESPSSAPVAKEDAPKSDAPKPDAPQKQKTPTTKPSDEMDEAAMEKFLKQHQKPWRVYEAAKKGWQSKIQAAEATIKELQSKKTSTDAEREKYAQQKTELLLKQLEEMKLEAAKAKQELAKRDYTASDEYRKNFVEKATSVYTEAVQFVTQLQVTDGDNERAATQADFDELRLLPLGARRKAAVDKFGDYAADVLSFVRDLDNIKRDAALAQQRHAENYERELAERETMTAKQRQEYDNFYNSALKGIQENAEYGKWFSETPDDPEASEILRAGFEEIEKATAQLDKLPLADQAAYAAVYRARAAAAPRLMLEISRRDQKLAELEAELAKFRGSDPGSKVKSGDVPPGSDARPMGIEDAVKVYSDIPNY